MDMETYGEKLGFSKEQIKEDVEEQIEEVF
jgi:hypothetical protein